MATLHIPHRSALPTFGTKRPSASTPQQFSATRAYTPDEDFLLEPETVRTEAESKRVHAWLGAGVFAVAALTLFLAFIPQFMMAVLLIGGITFLTSLIGVAYARAGRFGFGVASVVSLLAIALASSMNVVLGWFNNVLGLFS